MSRTSQNERPVSPCERYFEWNGEKGIFKYYDKESKKNVEVSLPFSFLVLDDKMSTIKGWSDEDQSGIWSNEIKDLKNGIITVRTKKGVRATGTYADIKGKVNGADYVKSLYIAFINSEKKMTIGNLALKGASLNAWIEFASATKDLYNGIVKVDSSIEGKKGKVIYQMPDFKMSPITEKAEALANELDRTLQDYFKVYFTSTQSTEDLTEEMIDAVLSGEPSAREVASIKSKSNAIVADDFDSESPF